MNVFEVLFLRLSQFQHHPGVTRMTIRVISSQTCNVRKFFYNEMTFLRPYRTVPYVNISILH